MLNERASGLGIGQPCDFLLFLSGIFEYYYVDSLSRGLVRNALIKSVFYRYLLDDTSYFHYFVTNKFSAYLVKYALLLCTVL